MSSSTANLKALGLNYSPNQISLPDGSMTQADDIVIRRDNVIESRRGIRRYSESFGQSTDRAKQLIEYKDRIISHYNSKLIFDTGVLDSDNRAILATFSGDYSETQTGLRIKSIEANKNLYFTTSDGIKKMSAVSANDFTTQAGFIQNAGAVKALDINAGLEITQGQLAGFLPADSTVAYRVVWGYKDANQNLLLGTPSNRIEVFNYLSDIISMDMNALAADLDNLNQSGSLITDGNYADTLYTPVATTAFELQNKVIALATKLDTDIYYGNTTGTGTPLTISTIDLTDNVVTINFSAGNATQYFLLNDYINLVGIDYIGSTFKDLVGNHKIDRTVNSGSIQFTLTHANIASSSPTTCQIYSYNYTKIINTLGAAANLAPNPLATLVLNNPATDAEYQTIEDALLRISERLKIEPIGTISTALSNAYIQPFNTTENGNARVDITIPTTITADYFVQVYRSRVFTATFTQTLGGSGGIAVVPDDEMRLVFEHFPSAAEVTAGTVVFLDDFPDSLVQNNTNLYTNPETGDGILQANDPPPFALDINTFKNVTFYANTRTAHTIALFTLLGVSNIVSGDKLTITNSVGSDTYKFITGVSKVSDIVFTAGSTITSGQYYILYSGKNNVDFIFWQRVNGVGTQPVVGGASPYAVYVMVDVLSTDTNIQVAEKNKSVINTQIFDFSAATNTSPDIQVTNSTEGITSTDTHGTSPFTVTVTTSGNGENAALKQVLLSSLISAAQAIQETAESLVRVINKQSDSVVSAYYISGDTTPPGQITLQANNLNNDPFYVLGSSGTIGSSFNPDISPQFTNITGISVANPSVLTFSSPHNLQNGDKIIISGSNSTPSIDGERIVTRVSSTQVSVNTNVTIAGTVASWSLPSDTTISINEINPNRIYYSKLNQPESVPLLNYFDIAAGDKEIIRIFPLRDSLFVFKQDGTYRVSGQVAPFINSLLDTSCIVIAPDTVAVSNNVVYAWTSKGITPITESGAGAQVSRPIDTAILALSSNYYPNFSTLTWGFGYDSDYSYTVYTNTDPTDTTATIGFRYCTLTNTWTNVQRWETCGIVNPKEDLLYLGSGKFNIIDRERKQHLRFDYADDDFTVSLNGNGLSSNFLTLQFTTVSGISPGDVITQEQTLTIYQYNQLLAQLDSDPSLEGGYLTALQAVPGDNMRSKIISLAQRLDSDPGTNFKDYESRISTKTGTITANSIASPTVVTSNSHGLISNRIITITGTPNGSIPSIVGQYEISNPTTNTFTIPVNVTTAGTTGLTFSTSSTQSDFADIEACYNDIINRLNTDSGVTFSSYTPIIMTTLFEAVVLAIDNIRNKITVNIPLQWVVGNIQIFKAINCEWTYSPCVLGDPLSTKQMSEATIMFRDRAITQFTASFNSDLFPEFFPIVFQGSGNGIFGSYSSQGFGSSYFGGASNSAPFRTWIPMNAQRCRYINTKINHNVAREEWALYGITLTGKVGISFRGYR